MLSDLALFATPPRELPAVLAAFALLAAAGFGALWGSFLNVVIARVPKGQSVVTPRSRCPSCGTQIEAVDNVPIVSWLLLRAKCRHCQAPISARYPFVELLGAVAGAACVARFGYTLPALECFVFTLTLIAIAFIDLDTFTVPMSLVVALAGSGLGFGVLRWQLLTDPAVGALAGDVVVDRVIGAVAAGLFLSALVVVATTVLRRTGRIPPDEFAMGWGDPLIMVGLGAHLGWQLMPLVLFLASAFGSVIGLALQWSGRLKNRGPVSDDDPWVPPDGAVPFGPFLALGGLIAAFFGDAMLARLLPALGLDAEGPIRSLFG
jgi:leader peptidase (prepilin peptidase)/N-methyltransferase